MLQQNVGALCAWDSHHSLAALRRLQGEVPRDTAGVFARTATLLLLPHFRCRTSSLTYYASNLDIRAQDTRATETILSKGEHSFLVGRRN